MVGKYPASAGWVRLIPEKPEPVPGIPLLGIPLESEADLEALKQAARAKAAQVLNPEWQEAWHALGDAAAWLALRYRGATDDPVGHLHPGGRDAPDASL